jgi:hypothetical protein
MKCKTEQVFIQAQYLHERLADIAIDLYVGSCTLSRLDSLLTHGAGHATPEDYRGAVEAGKYFLTLSTRRIEQRFHELFHNDDEQTTRCADLTLARW